MPKNRGFILAEIIISLLLVASISLLLLKQQWENTQFVRQIQLRLAKITTSNNNYELGKGGFSLSEILVCLLLVGILFSGLLQQYLQVYRQDKFLQNNIEQSFDLQYLSELLRASIRNAGFTPCANLNSLQTANLVAFKQLNAGFEVIRMSENYKTFSSLVDEIQLPISFKHNKSNKILISDCFHAEVLNYTLLTKDMKTITIKLNNPPIFRYVAPIYIGEMLREKFYLKGGDIYFTDNRASKLISGVRQFFSTIDIDKIVQITIIFNQLHPQTLYARMRSR